MRDIVSVMAGVAMFGLLYATSAWVCIGVAFLSATWLLQHVAH
jgi:hypothetical protein